MFVYMVTRDVENQKPGMRSIPNLGMHTSSKKADRHFESVLKSREDEGCKIHWINNDQEHEMPTSRYIRTREALIEYKTGEVERLQIERWRK